MRNKLILFSFLCFSSFVSKAQSPFGFYFQDTMKPGNRISGSLDSVDCYLASYQHTLPNFYNPFLFAFSYSDMNRTWFNPLKRRYSAIPHIAFAYSMGSKLAQLGRVTYTQTIDTNTYLQLDYTRNSSNGNLRNSKYERNSVQFSLMHAGKIYATILDIDFAFDNSLQSGGLVGDSLRLGFPLAFQQVTKSNASVKQRQVNVSFKNYVSFTKNENTKYGLVIQPRLQISNLRFSESDTLSGIYGLIQYDSTQTKDYRELSTAGLNGALFLKHKWMHLEAGVFTKYWDYDNLIKHMDTTEIGAIGSLMINPKGYHLNLDISQTFVGAKNESSYSVTGFKQFKGKNTVFLNASFSQRFPDVYQRSYYGNTVNYDWTNRILAKQFKSYIAWKNENRIIPVKISGFYESNTQMPVFLAGRWRQDTLTNLTVFGAEFSFDYQFKKLLVQGRTSYRNSTGNVLPNWLIGGRIAYNGTLFKGKKLKTVTGIDVGYISHFNLFDFAPYMNTYVFTNSLNRFSDQMKLHFFSQFDLGYFRWFIRLENIEQTFLKKANYEAVGYPVTPFQFRFGVSWDFFN